MYIKGPTIYSSAPLKGRNRATRCVAPCVAWHAILVFNLLGDHTPAVDFWFAQQIQPQVVCYIHAYTYIHMIYTYDIYIYIYLHMWGRH